MSTFSKTVPCKHPKWYNFRWKLSNILIDLARKIYPNNPEVEAFWTDLIVDQMIYGKAITRVNPEEMMKK